MKKLLVAAATAVVVLVPSSAAVADIPPPAGADRCPPGWAGVVVWRWNPVTQSKDYYPVCIYIGE